MARTRGLRPGDLVSLEILPIDHGMRTLGLVVEGPTGHVRHGAAGEWIEREVTVIWCESQLKQTVPVRYLQLISCPL